jgi:hypothetical protein
LCFANLADLLYHFSLRVANEVGDDVGVEKVAHQRSTGSRGKSPMGGKSSCSGPNVANTASRDLGSPARPSDCPLGQVRSVVRIQELWRKLQPRLFLCSFGSPQSTFRRLQVWQDPFLECLCRETRPVGLYETKRDHVNPESAYRDQWLALLEKNGVRPPHGSTNNRRPRLKRWWAGTTLSRPRQPFSSLSLNPFSVDNVNCRDGASFVTIL